MIEKLFYSYYDRLFGYASRFLDDPEAAEDIIQDVFASILIKKIKLPSEEAAGLSYLYTMVKNACLRHIDRLKLADKYLLSETETAVEQSVDLHIVQEELMASLNAEIGNLPPACSKIMKLGYLEGLKNEEIADQMNISIHTVKSQKQRAVKILRERIKR